MATNEQIESVKLVYAFVEPGLGEVALVLADDPQAVIAEASANFDEMIPDLAYVDDPGHPLGPPLFFSSALLALYVALRRRGVGVHEYGRAMHEVLEKVSLPNPDLAEELPKLIEAADASQRASQRGEFVFEVLSAGPDLDWGMNVKSCAICAQFSKYDAVDLVPYMCALDDVMSDRAGDGLRRSGTIALGAHQCDFRYQRGGEPRRLAEQYPDRIRIRSPGAGVASDD